MAAVIENTALKQHRLKMSYADYLEYASDAKIVEWVAGEVIEYMPPIERHQDIIRFLSVLLDIFIEFFNLGTLRFAPFEVKLWPNGPSREPDILFISNDNLSRLTDKRVQGSPDLIIEVISPGSVTEGRVRKFSDYEQAGVTEYWIIDPRPHQQHAEFFVLGEDNHYHSVMIDDQGVYRATVLPHFWLNLDWLRQEKLPNPQLILAEIMLSIEELPADAKSAYEALYHLLKRE